MSVSVITGRRPAYPEGMVRWEPGARGRLGQAAFELFTERGFEQVTVAEIAERAGLTERTFFRYFADKREVLFAGAEGFQELFVSGVASAPDSAAPIDAVAGALSAAAAMFMAHEDGVRRRSAIIAAHPDLRERELVKLSTVAAAVADALRRRGVTDPAASLTAEAGLAVFRIAFARLDRRPRRPRPRPAHRRVTRRAQVRRGRQVASQQAARGSAQSREGRACRLRQRQVARSVGYAIDIVYRGRRRSRQVALRVGGVGDSLRSWTRPSARRPGVDTPSPRAPSSTGTTDSVGLSGRGVPPPAHDDARGRKTRPPTEHDRRPRPGQVVRHPSPLPQNPHRPPRGHGLESSPASPASRRLTR